jgi:hypothetical protein
VGASKSCAGESSLMVATTTSTNLPTVTNNTTVSVQNILAALGLRREIIASNEEIENAWRELPREIARIPAEPRDGLIARMCVATSVGLFDGAINYAWNAVILNLRTRAKNFGLGYIAQTLNKKFEEDDLKDLIDSELFDLCHKLDLLSEESYFFLNQCRDVRNNFSSAHPSIAQIDDSSAKGVADTNALRIILRPRHQGRGANKRNTDLRKHCGFV